MKTALKTALGSLAFVVTSAFALPTAVESTLPQANQEIFGIGNPIIEEILGGKPLQLAAGCFKSGEERSGMNKICYYRCTSGTKAITISSTSLCPLSM